MTQPKYENINRVGPDHKPIFYVRCEISFTLNNNNLLTISREGSG